MVGRGALECGISMLVTKLCIFKAWPKEQAASPSILL